MAELGAGPSGYIASGDEGDTFIQDFAGQAEIQHLIIESGSGIFDIAALNGPLEQIIIYQNLFRPTLTAEIKLNDGNKVVKQDNRMLWI